MVTGKVYKFGDNIDTDVIIPARYLNAPSPEDLAKHCMEDIDPSFSNRVQPGDIIVGGTNFGCGSSREHAPISIRACGVSCVIAASFARIFYRNAINIGFPIMECPQAVAAVQNGDTLTVDFDSGNIHNQITGQDYQAVAFPPFINRIIENDGLLPYLKARQENEEGK
ncbi:MAG: 3-isopropylmalate dehydratase small subunit [Christensenellales bacterium]|nr:3-isopropylmalate dehydratase small subunit [Christensenellales bacterium]